MSTVTMPRSDVTSEEVADALRQGLGPPDPGLPETGINASSVSRPGSDQPDNLLVGTGSNRVLRAGVAIPRHSGQTRIDVRPGAWPGAWPGALKLVNRLWIARKCTRPSALHQGW